MYFRTASTPASRDSLWPDCWVAAMASALRRASSEVRVPFSERSAAS